MMFIAFYYKKCCFPRQFVVQLMIYTEGISGRRCENVDAQLKTDNARQQLITIALCSGDQKMDVTSLAKCTSTVHDCRM